MLLIYLYTRLTSTIRHKNITILLFIYVLLSIRVSNNYSIILCELILPYFSVIELFN